MNASTVEFFLVLVRVYKRRIVTQFVASAVLLAFVPNVIYIILRYHSWIHIHPTLRTLPVFYNLLVFLPVLLGCVRFVQSLSWLDKKILDWLDRRYLLLCIRTYDDIKAGRKIVTKLRKEAILAIRWRILDESRRFNGND